MSWHSVQCKAWLRLLKGIRNAEVEDNGKYKRQKRWTVIYIHKHHRRREAFENAETNNTRAVGSPKGKCACRQRLCLSAVAEMCLPLRWGKKSPKTQKGAAVTNFQTPKFWGWVKKLGKLFNIWNSSILLFFNKKVGFHDYKEEKKVCYIVHFWSKHCSFLNPSPYRQSSILFCKWLEVVYMKHIQPE